MKLGYARFVKELSDLAVGRRAARAAAPARRPDDGVFQQKFFNAVQASIGGGTDEIQRNIIGERFRPAPRASVRL